MGKKILVKESGVLNFFKSFFQAKADGRESQWLQRLRKADPDLADKWSDYDDKLSQSMQQQKRDLQSLGLDTTKVDAMIKKYGLKNI
jgi:hypothetical protein